MAALLVVPPLRLPFSPSSNRTNPRRTFSLPSKIPSPHPKALSLSVASPANNSLPCPCTAGTLDPEPAEENPITVARVGRKDRRRAVRIAWEKLVRWSRSWRSKAKSDVLERTKKVVVLGGGSFGTAMAAHVASKKNEMEVAMLVRDADVCRAINNTHFNCKYFPEDKLPENVVATMNPKDALLGADFCLHAVPVQFIFP